jgi:hypothetical protein
VKEGEIVSKEYFRVRNVVPVEVGLETENLEWVMKHRLKHTCLPSASRFIILMMCDSTNMGERNYFGGLESIQQITNYAERTVRKHVALLVESNLLDGKILHKYLYEKNMRQNYHIYLPPKEIITCAEWDKLNETESHKRLFPGFLTNFQRTSTVAEQVGRETEAEAFAIGSDGEVINYPDYEP